MAWIQAHQPAAGEEAFIAALDCGLLLHQAASSGGSSVTALDDLCTAAASGSVSNGPHAQPGGCGCTARTGSAARPADPVSIRAGERIFDGSAGNDGLEGLPVLHGDDPPAAETVVVVQDAAPPLEGNFAAAALRFGAIMHKLRGGDILDGQSERLEDDEVAGGTAARRTA